VGDYSFGFNGQEKEKQVTGADTHTSAEFWMYDSRAGRRWQLDPKPNLAISSYSCFSSNPIFYSDPLGDTLKINGGEKDQMGMQALEKFVSTKEGYSEIAKYAVKGQKVGSITFTKDGDLSDQIDLNINFGKEGQGGGTWASKDNDANGNGLNIFVDIYKGKGWTSDNEVWNKVISICHEMFLHTSSKASDYLDNCELDKSNIPNSVTKTMGLLKTDFDHVAVREAAIKAQIDKGSFLKSQYPWPGKAYAVLTTVSKKSKWSFSKEEIISQMWNYNGGLYIDKKGVFRSYQ
jgi:hypothetical protein